MNCVPEFIIKMLHNVARNENFTKFTIDLKTENLQKGGMGGVFYPVQINGTKLYDGITQQVQLNLLCKTPPLDVKRPKHVKSYILFEREIYVYEILLPEYKRFQREKGLLSDENFISIPKCYATRADVVNNEYVLILDDLRVQGYSVWGNQLPMPVKHIEWLLIELGKFHGTGFALKEQKPEVYEGFKELYDIFLKRMKMQKADVLLSYAIDRTSNLLEDDNQKKLYEMLKKKYVSLIDSRTGDNSAEKFRIVIHGDLWKNNILFQRDQTVRLINETDLIIKFFKFYKF